MTTARVKALVMMCVALAWLGYVGAEVWRDRQPEVWTWGIPSGVYVALYQPWSGRQNPGGRAGTLGRAPVQRQLPAEDEA